MKLRKTIAIILIILIFILGYLSVGIISFFGMRSYYGYEGYCSETKLKNFVNIQCFEVLIICILISYAIFLEAYQRFEKHQRFYKMSFVLLVANLIFLVCKIIEYPIIIEDSGGGQDYFHMMYNPLAKFLAIYSSVIIWINYRFQKKTKSLKIFPKIFFLLVVISFVIVAVIFVNSEYQVCRG